MIENHDTCDKLKSSSYYEVSKIILAPKKEDGFPLEKTKISKLKESYKTRESAKQRSEVKESIVSGINTRLLNLKKELFLLGTNENDMIEKSKKLEIENDDLRQSVRQCKLQLGLVGGAEGQPDVEKSEYIIAAKECKILKNKLMEEQEKVSNLEDLLLLQSEDVLRKEATLKDLTRQLAEVEEAVAEREKFLTTSMLEVAEVFNKSREANKQDNSDALRNRMLELESEIRNVKKQVTEEIHCRRVAEKWLSVANTVLQPKKEISKDAPKTPKSKKK